MGGRDTRAPQSKELLRAKNLREALDRGSAPAFVPPVTPDPATPPSSLSWALELDAAVQTLKSTPEEVLDFHRQYLEQLFLGSPDPLIIVDTSFHTLCVNPQFERMFGFPAAQILGQSIDALIFPPDRSGEAQWIGQCLQRGERITLETQRCCKDGTLLDVISSCGSIVIDSRTVGFFAIYRDISERKNAEALSSALYRIAEKD